MATYPEAGIFNALMSRVASLPLGLPIAWPNASFTPPQSGYLRVNHLPNDATQAGLGDAGENRHIGILQVDVMWPKGQGLDQAKERAGQVAAHFKRGTDITHDGVLVVVYRPPRTGPALSDGSYAQIPVEISYRADVPNPA